MPNFLYDAARQMFLTGGFDWTNSGEAVRVALTTNGYTATATQTSYDDIPGSSIVAQANLSTRAAVAGAADAADTTFTAVSGATPITRIVLYWDKAGPNSGKTLIAHIDTATGLPITPNGGDIIIVWDNGVNRIFRL